MSVGMTRSEALLAVSAAGRDVRFDLAPLEGVTDFTFRTALCRFFPGADRCYSPFIAANQTCSMKTREKKDVAPEHNSGVLLVPQILTNRADVFVWAAKEMAERGWTTVNLNLGCPSATVFTHGKGAGFLSDPSRLDAFFESVFETVPDGIRVSVKTRIGIEDAKEAPALLEVFNRYPLDELIVHPRLRKDFYKGKPDLDAYRLFYEGCRGNLTYNGDIFSAADLEALLHVFPRTCRVMIGRGAIRNPAVFRMLRGGAGPDAGELMRFHDEVLAGRMEDLQGFANTAGKMKEQWFYMGSLFEHADRYLKAVKKARTLEAYRAAVRALFENCRLAAC